MLGREGEEETSTNHGTAHRDKYTLKIIAEVKSCVLAGCISIFLVVLIFVLDPCSTGLCSNRDAPLIRKWLDQGRVWIASNSKLPDWPPYPKQLWGLPQLDPGQHARLQRKLHCLARKGSWVRNERPRELPWLTEAADPGVASRYQMCDVRHEARGGIWGKAADKVAQEPAVTEDRWTVRETLKYEWQTTPGAGCSFEKPTGEQLCRVLAGRSVAFVGDSLSQEHAESLVIATRALKAHRGWRLNPGTGRRGCISEANPNGSLIYFVRSDHLNEDTDVLASVLPRMGPSPIFIVNTGLHFLPLEEVLSNIDALTRVLSNRTDALLLWRNTATGHLGCANATGPIDRPQYGATSEGWLARPHKPVPYHWGDIIEAENKVVGPHVVDLGFVWMDIRYSTSLRIDGHFVTTGITNREDCVHYCIPGPVDNWVHMLYNYLVAIQEVLVGSS